MIALVLPIEFHMIRPVMHLLLAHLAITLLNANAMFDPLCYFFLAPILPGSVTRCKVLVIVQLQQRGTIFSKRTHTNFC
jgi:hypothetical protein